MKTTSILELRLRLDELIEAGHGEVQIVAHTIHGKKPIESLLEKKEPWLERMMRQVECSITVVDAIEILKATDPVHDWSICGRFGRGRAFEIADLVNRSEYGNHYILKPSWPANPTNTTAEGLVVKLERMLALETPEDRKKMRLVLSRYDGPMADRVHALRSDSIRNPWAAGGDRKGGIRFTGTLIPAEKSENVVPG